MQQQQPGTVTHSHISSTLLTHASVTPYLSHSRIRSSLLITLVHQFLLTYRTRASDPPYHTRVSVPLITLAHQFLLTYPTHASVPPYLSHLRISSSLLITLGHQFLLTYHTRSSVPPYRNHLPYILSCIGMKLGVIS